MEMLLPSKSRRVTLAAIALATIAAFAAIDAAPASASLSVPSFTLTPSITQAGANPDLTIDVGFAGGDPQSVALSLAAGLLANPTVPATCSASQLQSATCPSGSQIGSGTVTATDAGLPLSSPATLYLVQAQPEEVARIGMVVSSPLGTAVVQAPVTVRSTPDVGANLTFSNLPNSIGGVPVTITGIHLTLNGSVGGQAFTRNPTACHAATTGLTATSHQGGTASAQSSFTPTGCAALAFAPKLGATGAVAGWDGATAVTSTISQAASEAALKQATLTLPYGVAPRSDAYSRACTASDVSTCPSSSTVGTAAVTTPLSAQPLSGRVVLVSSGGSSVPGFAIVLPSPYAIVLTSSNSLTSQGYAITYTNLPDLPLTSVQVSLAGGSDSLLVGGYALCGGWPRLSGSFAAQSGATSTGSTPISVSGCP
jgi:hypothetical protein